MVSGGRKSKRARKGRAPIKISAFETLWDLKLRICEALGIHPKNAEIYAQKNATWEKLEGDEASLGGGMPR
jgi:hypothetical protein